MKTAGEAPAAPAYQQIRVEPLTNQIHTSPTSLHEGALSAPAPSTSSLGSWASMSLGMLKTSHSPPAASLSWRLHSRSAVREETNMRRITPTLAAMMTTAGLSSAAPASATEDVVIVYDASGSMWRQVDGTSKIEVARDVMAELVSQWDADTRLGLVAYGHRRQGDCRDIETLVEPGPIDKAHFIDMYGKPLEGSPCMSISAVCRSPQITASSPSA